MADGAERSGTWNWSPRDGRWTPRQGYPETAAFVSMSTADFGGADAYDAWRHHAYYTFDADPLPPGETRDFKAAVAGVLSTHGEFYRYTSHAMSGRGLPGAADRDGGDPLSLGFVVDGERRSREAHDETQVAGAGDFFLYDPRRSIELSWTRHRAMHVMLRRPDVERMLGRRALSTSAMLDALKASQMAPLLRDQFAVLTRTLAHLDPQERSFLLDQTIRLALFACSRTAEPESDGLFVAANRLIERRLGDAALSPEALATTLGVSRATLYRAFAQHDQGVGEVIRAMRLDHARRRIASGTRIADSALACGWPDTGNFARAFKARFGMRPSEIRETD